MGFNPSAQQKKAINANGSVLVSAAAGSGKTATLVQRIIRLITGEHPIDVNRLLIVTFTNQARGEMASRIESELYRLAAQNPDDQNLQRQKRLIHSAKIRTIDSFCIDLVKDNYDKLGLPPDFKIGEEEVISSLQDTLIDEAIDECLTQNPHIAHRLFDILGCHKKDKTIHDEIKELYKFSQNIPFQNEFFDRLRYEYHAPLDINHPWIKSATAGLIRDLEDALGVLAGVKDEIATHCYNEKFAKNVNQCYDAAHILLQHIQNGEFEEIAKEGKPQFDQDRYSDKDLKQSPVFIKYKNAKEKILKKKIFTKFEPYKIDISAQREYINYLAPAVDLLLDIVKSFSEKLFYKKCEKNCFYFYDAEQKAIELLCKKQGDSYVKTEFADEVIACYDEVLVDEYQDVNDLQSILFDVLSDDKKHLFCVGDIKQSIYRFRGSNPDKFLEKRLSYKPYDTAGDEDNKCIIMQGNYRSKASICDFVNYFFSLFMTRSTCGMDYGTEEMLIPENNSFISSTSADITALIIHDGDNTSLQEAEPVSESEIQEETSQIYEARAVYEYIRKLMEGEPFLTDEQGNPRPANYGDFAILYRGSKKKIAWLCSELITFGVPVSYSAENFFDTREITVACSLLRCISNPFDDVSILSVMLSQLYPFTTDDIAALRLTDSSKGRKKHLYSLACGNSDNALLSAFVNDLKAYRRLVCMLPLSTAIEQIFEDCHLTEIMSSGVDGNVKINNIHHLVTLAANYERNVGGGLQGFLNYLSNKKQSGYEYKQNRSFKNAVTITTMHTSKGMQYPVCILVDLTTNLKINHPESHKFVINTQYGIGYKYIDDSYNEIVPIGYTAITQKNKRDEFMEELRILYVAMTRAQNKLCMVMSVSDYGRYITEKAADAVAYTAGDGANLYDFKNCSYSSWIFMSLLLNENLSLEGYLNQPGMINKIPCGAKINVEIVDKNALSVSEVIEQCSAKADEALMNRLFEIYRYQYPYTPLHFLEQKTTVTRLVGRDKPDTTEPIMPEFLQGRVHVGASRGTATHKILEKLPFDREVNLKEYVDYLVEHNFISEKQGEIADIKGIEIFLKSGLFKRIQGAISGGGIFRREMSFLTGFEPGELDNTFTGDFNGEKIMLQGAVDLCFEEQQGITIVDFKTDWVENESQLVKKYSDQLNWYALACEKIFNMPVKGRIIYSLCLNREIEV